MKNENQTDALFFPPLKTEVTNSSTPETKNSRLIPRSPEISYTGEKRKRRFSFGRFLFFLLILFIFLFSVSLYAERKLEPEIRRLAEAQGQKYLLETVNRAVGELAAEGSLSYGNLVGTIRDEKGEVIYLEVNTAMLTKAKTNLVTRIDQSLSKRKTFPLSVPLGSLSDFHLFSGMGLPVKVRLFPIGMTEGDIDTLLEDCGINQTRHLIRVHVKTAMMIVLPHENITVETEVTIPLGERVLVGDVPEIYLDTLGVN